MLPYSGKVWQVESLANLIRQTKTIQISTYNYNFLAESIHLPNFSPNAENKYINSLNFLFAKTFPLYSIYSHQIYTKFTLTAMTYYILYAQHSFICIKRLTAA